jgi:hypothetical protein
MLREPATRRVGSITGMEVYSPTRSRTEYPEQRNGTHCLAQRIRKTCSDSESYIETMSGRVQNGDPVKNQALVENITLNCGQIGWKRDGFSGSPTDGALLNENP